MRTTHGRCGPSAVEREEERQPLDQVRRDDAHQVAALLVRLADEADVAHLQVAQAAVDELRRGARRRAGEVAALDERDVEAVRGRRLGDPGADDPAADHQQVEPAAPRAARPRYAIHSGFVQARLPFRVGDLDPPVGLAERALQPHGGDQPVVRALEHLLRCCG